jgi:hypothetical protein
MRCKVIEEQLYTVLVVFLIYELEESDIIGRYCSKDGEATQRPLDHSAWHISPSLPGVRLAGCAPDNRFIIVYDDFTLL